MREISSQIKINASDEQVWNILTDFSSFPEWNPFIRRISGKPEAGKKLEAFLQPPNSKGMTFRPTMLKAEKNRELRWLGKLWISGLFNGEHAFIIDPIDESHIQFTQYEKFTGLLVPLFGSILANTQHGFEEMNQALKEQVEKG